MCRARRRTLATLLASSLAACAAAGFEPVPRELGRFEFARAAMGTEFRVLCYAPDEMRARGAAEAAFARIAALERALSDYDPESELTRLGARSEQGGAPTPPIPLSRELGTVLAAAQELARASDGAFDVTAGPFVRLWRRARRQERLPEAAELAAAATAVGYEKLVLEPGARAARLLAPGMRLDLGGIAKGYALDEALAVLVQRGVPCALLVGGGELRAGQPPPGKRGWSVALAGLEPAPGEAPPTLLLAQGALATSGDLAQFLELDGVRYSHILDPRSGLALSEQRLVSVLGARGMLSDALATALSVLGPEPGLALLTRYPGFEARVLVRRAGRVECFHTPGFPPLSCASPREPAVDPGPSP